MLSGKRSSPATTTPRAEDTAEETDPPAAKKRTRVHNTDVVLFMGMNQSIDAETGAADNHPDTIRATRAQKLHPEVKVYTVAKTRKPHPRHIVGNFHAAHSFDAGDDHHSWLDTAIAARVIQVELDYVFCQPGATYRNLYGEEWTKKIETLFSRCPKLELVAIPFCTGCMAPGTEPEDESMLRRRSTRDQTWLHKNLYLFEATDSCDTELVAVHKDGRGNKTNDCFEDPGKGMRMLIYSKK